MNPQLQTLGTVLRGPLVLGVCLFGGVYIGRRYDAPVEGIAGGLVAAAFLNGYMDYMMVRNQVTA